MLYTGEHLSDVDWLVQGLSNADLPGAGLLEDPAPVLASLGLDSDVLRQPLPAESDLRAIPGTVASIDDANTPSQGPQCTQAGCFTYGNCPSKYACSGEPRCR